MGIGQETKDFMLPGWLRDVDQEDQEQVQVTWPGAERGVSWQEAQIRAEMAERGRKIWEDSYSQGTPGTI